MANPSGLAGLFSSGRIDAARDLLLSPVSDVRSAFIITMFCVIMVLLIILIALFIFVPRRKIKSVQKKRFIPADKVGQQLDNLPIVYKDRKGNILNISDDGADRLKDVAPAKHRVSNATFTLITAIVILIVLAISYGYGTSNSFCVNACHDNNIAVQKAAKTNHALCVSCHVGGRWSAPVANTTFMFSRVAKLAGQKVKHTPVLSQNCLNCHKDIQTKTVETAAGVRMKHKEVLETGQDCISCHVRIGHKEGSGYTQRMDRCLECHNDGDLEVATDSRLVASAKCETCHNERVALSPQMAHSKRIVFGMVQTGTLECKRCHDVKASCNPCHGLELPHPKSFLEHDHARMAAFGRKKLCWRCHTEKETCGKCHNNFNTHASNWETLHAQNKSWRKCGGPGCHRQTPAGQDICAACHTHYK